MRLLSALLASCVVLVATWPPPAATRLRRLRSGDGGTADHAVIPRSPSGAVLATPRARAAAAALAGTAGALLVGGVAGLLVGTGAGLATWRGLGRLEPAGEMRARERTAAALPLAAELLAAAVAAGSPPDRAAMITGAALGGRLGYTLERMGALLQAGGDPRSVMASSDASVRPLSRALAVAISRGASPVAALERAAADARDAARLDGQARARALGVRAAAPLGLCFLPAFVLVGVVPLIASAGVLLP